MNLHKRSAALDLSPRKVFKIRFAEPPSMHQDDPPFKDWNHLPSDVVEQIMLSSALSFEDVINMSMTCKSWKPHDITLNRIVCRKRVDQYRKAYATCSQVIESIVETVSEEGKMFILKQAIICGSIETLRKCHERGYCFNSVDNSGRSVLCTAIMAGNVQVIEFLIRNCSAYVNLVDNFGESPLMFAVMKGSREMVNCLLNNGASIYTQAYDLATPLYLAVNENRIDIAELLLKHGSPTESADSDDTTPFHLAVRNKSIEMIKLLHRFGSRMDYTVESSGFSAIHQASFQGDIEIINFIINNGIDINMKTIDGKTILHTACIGCQFHVCEWIINRGGVNVNEKDDYGQTALHYAVENHKLDLIQLFLENDADPFVGDAWLKISLEIGWSNLKVTNPNLFSSPFVRQLLLDV